MAHEVFSNSFYYKIFNSLDKEYRKNPFFHSGHCLEKNISDENEPDFSIRMKLSCTNPAFISEDGNPPILCIGEVASSEPTSHLLAKCAGYFKTHQPDFVLGIDILENVAAKRAKANTLETGRNRTPEQLQGAVEFWESKVNLYLLFI